MIFARVFTIFSFFALFLAGNLRAEELRIIASFTLPADWAKNVGGEHVSVHSLTPENSDLHSRQPGAADLRKLNKANLIVAIDSRLENRIAELTAGESLRAKTLFLADSRTSENNAAHTAGEHDCNENSDTNSDPHIWMNPAAVIPMINKLAARLAEIDPAHAGDYKKNAENYIAELRKLDTESEKKLAGIPPEKRILITGHRNLKNFADRYGFKTPAAIIDNAGTETPDTSAGKLRNLIKIAKASKTPLFCDISANQNLVTTVTREAGLPPPVTLCIDSLDTPEKPSGTYLGMFRENVRKIADALK